MNKTQEVLNYIQDYINANNIPPTVREICCGVGFSSTATAQYHINKLKKQGTLSLSDTKNRSITLNTPQSISKKDVKMVAEVGTVTAGTPILALENLVGYTPLPSEFVGNGETFILQVSGSSMINAGIMDNDKIIVEKTPYCENGDIVVALIEDSATCKRFYKRNNKIILHPENDNFSDIVLDSVEIIGKVKGLIRKFY